VATARLPAVPRMARLGWITLILLLLLYLAAVMVAVYLGPPERALRALRLLAWGLLFGASLGLMLLGARWDRPAWINWSVVAVGGQALARYMDLFGSMLQTSALFFSAGALVLLLGWGLERMRRRMLEVAVAHREVG